MRETGINCVYNVLFTCSTLFLSHPVYISPWAYKPGGTEQKLRQFQIIRLWGKWNTCNQQKRKKLMFKIAWWYGKLKLSVVWTRLWRNQWRMLILKQSLLPAPCMLSKYDSQTCYDTGSVNVNVYIKHVLHKPFYKILLQRYVQTQTSLACIRQF